VPLISIHEQLRDAGAARKPIAVLLDDPIIVLRFSLEHDLAWPDYRRQRCAELGKRRAIIVCLLASQYSLIDRENALHNIFPAARAKGVSFVVGSSLNAGFISGSQCYNYGKENYKIPQPIIEKRERLREAAARHGVDLRTAALQFSATPDLASALVVGAASEQQIVADFSSMQVKIPAEFWAELKERKLIEQDAPVPA
jgi:D-threo-aldose 1-dehydrogenase